MERFLARRSATTAQNHLPARMRTTTTASTVTMTFARSTGCQKITFAKAARSGGTFRPLQTLTILALLVIILLAEGRAE